MNKIVQEIKRLEKSSETTEFFDKYFSEIIALFFTKIFVRLNIHPNLVSMLSAICGVYGGYLLYFRNVFINLFGILFIFLSNVFDNSDGQVARDSGKASDFGRVIDGICDAFVYISVYFFISLRLSGDVIPFTNGVTFGFMIWPIAFIAGYCQKLQAAMADYFRILYLYFKKGLRKKDFDLSCNLKAELKSCRKFTKKFFYLYFYHSYTKDQENHTPRTLKMLLRMQNIRDKGDNFSEKERMYYLSRARKYCIYPRLLGFHIKSIILYVLVLIKCYVLYFPIVVLVFGTVNIIMVNKFEKLSLDFYNFLGEQHAENQ